MRIRTAILMSMLLLCTMVAGAGERSVATRNPQPEVLQKYESLQFLDRQELREAMAEMTPQMHADVWTVHLLRILRQHPEFTAEQRSLIYEGLGLIASGIFEIDRTSREWTVDGRRTLRDLAKRVNAAFPPEISRALMSDPRDSMMTEPATPADRLNRFRIGAQWSWCTCNIFFQTDCGWGVCFETDPYCWPYHSCGPWMWDTCDGVCG